MPLLRLSYQSTAVLASLIKTLLDKFPLLDKKDSKSILERLSKKGLKNNYKILICIFETVGLQHEQILDSLVYALSLPANLGSERPQQIGRQTMSGVIVYRICKFHPNIDTLEFARVV